MNAIAVYLHNVALQSWGVIKQKGAMPSLYICIRYHCEVGVLSNKRGGGGGNAIAAYLHYVVGGVAEIRNLKVPIISSDALLYKTNSSINSPN